MSNEMALWAEIKRLQAQLADLKTIEVPGRWVYLKTPLTSTAWGGDARSTTAKTLIDLSAVFGVPAEIKCVNVNLKIRDSQSSVSDAWFILSPNNTSGVGKALQTRRDPDDMVIWGDFIVPCNADGDFYFQCAASGVGTLDVWLEIWAYQR